MMTWGFWIVFAVGLAAVGRAGMWIEDRIARRRRGQAAIRRLKEAE